MRIKHGLKALVLIQLFLFSAVIGALSPIALAANNDINRITSQLESADNLGPEFVPGEVLIQFRRSVSVRLTSDMVTTGIASVDKLNTRFEVNEIKRLFSDVYKLKLPKDADVLSITRKYEEDPNVEYAELNLIGSYFAVPDDPGYPKQWAHKNIQSEYAWNTTTGDPNVVIAIVDIGVQYNHSDLAANIWNNTDETIDNGVDDDNNGYVDDVRGWNFVDNNNNPMDTSGHGTHVAGIAAAVTNNTRGVAGVSWHSKIMALKNGPPLTVESCASAIMYAANNGADIISMSWGFRSRSETLHNALKYAFDKGLLLVAAAGNEHWNIRIYPAAYEEVIAVTATDQYNNPWVDPSAGSNYGSWVEIAAPGKDLYSTYFYFTYMNESGTSGAAPHVSGLAALIWSRFPNMTRDQVREQLRRTAVDLGTPGFDIYYGYGRINASRAVNQDIPDHDLLVWSWKLPFASEPGDGVIVNTTVLNFGKSTESNVLVKLLVNGAQVDSKNITILNSGNSTIVSCSWTPTASGKYNITTYVEPKEGEVILENNVRSANAWIESERVVKVPQDFATIKEAVDATNLEIYYGDATIRVASNNTYYEHDLFIQNSLTSLTLIGENRSTTIVDSQGQGDASIRINSAHVNITGFTIQNITSVKDSSKACIKMFYADSSAISYNTIKAFGTSYGIYVESDIYKSIINNNVILYGIEGIELSGSVGCFISNNIILYSSWNGIGTSPHSDAYSVSPLSGSNSFPSVGHLISNNSILHSGNCGIYLDLDSDNNTISGNIISNSPCGLEIDRSNGNSVNGNTISNCSLYGIEIFSLGVHGPRTPSENNSISGNTLQRNQYGIYLYTNNTLGDVYNNTIKDNTVSNNYYGVYVSDLTSNNFIYHNNFINNTVQATNLGEIYDWDDGYPSGGNYWSDYNGTDLCSGPNQNQTDSDGIGDSRYFINTYSRDDYPLMHPWGSIRNVDTGILYLTVQKAINAPETLAGHTIEVKAGTYYENVVLNKSLTLIGQDPSTTIIDGSEAGNVVTVQADNCIIRHFTIQNGGTYTHDGIYEESCKNTLISGNILSDNCFGICLSNSTSNTLVGNTISNNKMGIYVTNPLYGPRGAVSADSGNHSICGNIVSNNGYESADAGIYIYYSKDNTIRGNTISNNTRVGIELYRSYNTTTIENVISNNVVGLRLYLSETPFENCTSYHNNFINNTEAQASRYVSTYLSSKWDDGYPSGGNYWSDYNGADLYNGPYQNETGSDNIGDTPYIIDIGNNDRYPLMSPWPVHDIAVTDVTATPTEVLRGDCVSVTVTVINQGDFTETFNVTAYYDNNFIGTQVVMDLASRESKILIFPWNTASASPRGYTIKAVASVVPDEANTTDNTKIDGTVTVKAWDLLDEPWNQLSDWTAEGKGISTIATLDGKSCLNNKPNKGTYITRKKDIGTLPETGYTVETSLYINSWGTGGTNALVAFKFYDGMHLVTIEIRSNRIVGSQNQFSLQTNAACWYTWRFVVDSDAHAIYVYRDKQYVGTLTGLTNSTADDGLAYCSWTQNPPSCTGCESYTDYIRIATGLYIPS